MAADILVDTSIWVDFFRNKTLSTSQKLIQLLDQDRALLTGIVVTELVRGARNALELKTLRDLLKPVPQISTPEETWDFAGVLAYQLSKKGYAIFTVDAIIAAIAIQNQLKLFSGDKHFTFISKHSDLKMYI